MDNLEKGQFRRNEQFGQNNLTIVVGEKHKSIEPRDDAHA